MFSPKVAHFHRDNVAAGRCDRGERRGGGEGRSRRDGSLVGGPSCVALLIGRAASSAADFSQEREAHRSRRRVRLDLRSQKKFKWDINI